MQEAIDRVAAGLKARGVGPGDPVAIVLPNCPQHIIAFYAILRLGAVVVEHNPLYTPRELRKQFEDHGAKHAIVWSKVVATVQEFPADLRVVHAHLGRRHQGDAVPHPPRAAASDREGPGVARGPDHARERCDLLGGGERIGTASGHPPQARHRRPRDHPVHERHDGNAEGRGAHASQSALERRAGARVGAVDPPRRGLRRLRRPADVPRLRAHAVPHLRDVDGRPARAVPEVRPRHGARGDQEASRDLPSPRPADRRPAPARGQ